MKILIAENKGFSPRALEMLRAIGAVQAGELDESELVKAVADSDVLWVRLRHYIGADLLRAAPGLKWIVSATTGLNHIDLAACEKHGVRVLCLRGEIDFLKEIRATAEFTIGLMLALIRHIPVATGAVVNGEWNRDRYRGHELYKQDVGLIGFGRLGKIVAQYLRAFGSRVGFYDPAVKTSGLQGVTWYPLRDLLGMSRIVSLHAACTPENIRFFDARCFASMKAGSWFINTARGELVDESAMLDALRTGHLAGAACDVLSNENQLDTARNPLVRFAVKNRRKLILTPHIGGCTEDSMVRVECFMAQKLKKALECAES